MADKKNPYIGKIGNTGTQHIKVRENGGGKDNKVVKSPKRDK